MSRNERVETVASESGPDGRHSTSVALELGRVLDRPATDLAPLADSVDPEAIDRLFDGAAPEADVRLAFEHEDCRIEVTPSTIEITPSETTGRST